MGHSLNPLKRVIGSIMMVLKGDARSLDYRSLGGVVGLLSGMVFLITSANSPLGLTVWASTGVYLGGRCRMRRISQAP